MGTPYINIEKFYYEKRSQDRRTVGHHHYHGIFEIYYLEKGTCHYFIDNDTYDVKTGDIVLIPEGTIHKTMYGESDVTRRLIYCDSQYIPPELLRELSSISYVYRNKNVSRRVLEMLELIEREYTSPDRYSNDMILHSMHQIFVLLARNMSSEAPRTSGSSYTAQTIAYIKENYAQDIRLGDLATRCSVSPEHLSRVFKQDTGFGVSEYITVIRLQRSQLLLKTRPDLSVAEIAGKCGFNDSNYFSTKFKAMYGVSPLTFRSQEKNA